VTSSLSRRPWVTNLLWVLALGTVWIFIIPKIPETWSDRLGLFSIRNIAQMITALTFIQALGGLIANNLGHRAGTVSSGLLGGFISSTAVTTTAARKSRKNQDDTDSNLLLYFSSTLSMLIEGLVIVMIGYPAAGFSIYSVFSGPILVTAIIGRRKLKNIKSNPTSTKTATLDLLVIFRLTLFLVIIIALSRLIRHVLGNAGLIAVTLLASFFEIHATLISNTALRNSGQIEISLFILLIALSLCASYLSKLFIVRSLGSREMFISVRRWTVIILISLLASTAFALLIA
jgi:uncharacterized membrane protein (DUF4010 family)